MKKVAYIAASLIALAGLVSPVARAATAPTLTIAVLSSPANFVSGGDALIRITADATPDLTLDGQPVATPPNTSANTYQGLVTGLHLGANELRVTTPDATATITLVDHSTDGPLFSGPHQDPYICETQGAALGAQLDANCNAPVQIKYFYQSTQPTATLPNTPLADPCAPYPSDVASTTTVDGVTVPFVIRTESGVIDRAVYRIAILDDPHARGCDAPYHHTKGWNDRLIYAFGGGCGTGHHQGGNATSSFARIDEMAFTRPTMSLGYAQMTTSLNEAGVSCNDVTSAETAEMLKEYFIKNYGVPRWTLGRGGSGGALQQNMIASNYPGILDGIFTTVEFPDNTTVAPEVMDCKLLVRAFGANPAEWNEQSQEAVTGFATSDTCATWNGVFAPSLDPKAGCDASIPKDEVYDPQSNPHGVRCTLQDNERNIYGVDPRSGAAPSWYDNTGVQYGLNAYLDGRITPLQFVDLNASIGGVSLDSRPVPSRTSAALDTIETAYGSGRVTDGRALGDIPILSVNHYVDEVPMFDVHDRIRQFIMRARLTRANGDAANQVLWSYSPQDLVYQPFVDPPAYTRGLSVMTQWLDAVSADPREIAPHAKVVADLPSTARDGCVPADDAPPIDEPAVYGATSPCNALFPTHLTPRLVAGAPLTDDVLKCSPQPVDAALYARAPIPLSAAQLDQLKQIFPNGVCDYSKPGLGARAPDGTWQSFDTPFTR